MNPKPRLMTGIALAFALIVTGGTAFAKHHPAVFTVQPNGHDDTASLQAAFDAAVQAGPGSTVQLVKGTYYLSAGIVVTNFDGNFVGAGKDKTVVQNLGVLPASTVLLTFYAEGDAAKSGLITISDLTLRAIGPAETDPGFFMGPLNTIDLLFLMGTGTGQPDSPPDYLNASVIRVGFEGQSGEQYTPWGCNVSNGIDFMTNGWENLIGNYLFQDCTFKNTHGGVSGVGLQDSHVMVEGCTFEDVLGPIGMYGFDHTAFDIRCNRIQNRHILQPLWSSGVYLMNYMPGSNSVVCVSHNEISAQSAVDGIRVEDFGFDPAAGVPTIKHTVISDNDIFLDGDWSGGIGGAFISNVRIVDNTISGHGRLGIYTGNAESAWWGFQGDDFTPSASNWVIVGNNLKRADTLYSPILLGPNSSHCLVKADADDVLNLGTDNTIIDVPAKH
ncbi:MAG TPA: right-handed parallel beta-helix repeat-containing protein [Opitutaceae bacterium]|nr:right-handed parallel beta-helix repeat-containing protein [Opitutaceae bacterium]